VFGRDAERQAADLLADLHRRSAPPTRHGRPLDAARLQRIVAGTGKRRFESAGGRIRAAQGHSADVDLGLAPVVPPDVLHHGTVARFLTRPGGVWLTARVPPPYLGFPPGR
jgi:RNA:NAD 2'-phosphotransferase (TPT1/KptA family)